jgi:hypothetical protein
MNAESSSSTSDPENTRPLDGYFSLKDVRRHEHDDRSVPGELPLCGSGGESQRDTQRMLKGAGRKHLIRIADDLCPKWTPPEVQHNGGKVRHRRRRSHDDRLASADCPAHERVDILTVPQQTTKAGIREEANRN